MPTERMPPETEEETPSTVEQQMRTRNSDLFSLYERQRQIGEQQADELGLEGDRRVSFMNIVDRDIMNRILPAQTAAVMPPGMGRQQSRAAIIEPVLDPFEQETRTREEIEMNNLVSRILEEAKSDVLSNEENRRKLEHGNQQEQSEIRDLLDRAVVNRRVQHELDPSRLPDEVFTEYARRLREVEQARGADVEMIEITTQSGLKQEIPWPRTNEGKIERFRNLLNDIEGNFAEEGTGTHRSKLQELFGVVPALQESSDPMKKALGEKLFEEFTRRYAFHQSYVKFATTGDINGVMEGVGGPYDLVNNLLLRDLDHGYYATYDQPDPRYPDLPNLKKTETLAQNKDLMVWYSFNWYHQKADEILNTAIDEQGKFHDQLKDFLKEEYHLTDVDATSSQLLGQRMWEVTLRRALYDDVVDNVTGESLNLSTAAARRAYWEDPERREQIEERAREGGIEFKGKTRGGNMIARRSGMLSILYPLSVWRNFRFKSLDIIEGIDFNARDMFAHIPGDVETYIKEELIKIYRTTDITDEQGRNTRLDPKAAGSLAASEATKITQAILGVDKNKGTNGRSWSDEMDLVDFSKLVFVYEDFDHLVRQGQITQEEADQRKQILEKYVYVPDREITEDTPAEERAAILLSQHFKEGLFDFKRVRPPAAMLPATVKMQEDIRGLLTKSDGPLRHPDPKSMIQFGEAFAPTNAGQWDRKMQIVRNYIAYERRGGFFGQTGITPEQAEIIVNELGLKLELELPEIGNLKWDLIYDEQLKKDWMTALLYLPQSEREQNWLQRRLNSALGEERYQQLREDFNSMLLFALEARMDVANHYVMRALIGKFFELMGKEIAKGK